MKQTPVFRLGQSLSIPPPSKTESDPGTDTAEEVDKSGGSDTASTVSWAVSSDGFSTDVSESRLL